MPDEPDLALHPQTRAELMHQAARPAHALLLAGPTGSGKTAVAEWLAGRLLGLPAGRLLDSPRLKQIVPDKTTISIESVRDMQAFVKLKMAGQADGIQRIVMIEQAQCMGHEAQNALLKLCEEPPADTVLLLTVSSAQRLLPTIRSRTQIVPIRRVAAVDSTEYFTEHGFAADEVQRAYMLSGGLSGLMHSLLTNADHPLLQAVTTARELLQATPFERLARVDALAKQKDAALHITHMLQHMAQTALEQQAAKQAANQTLRRWQSILQAAYETENALQASVQAKLALTSLMLRF